MSDRTIADLSPDKLADILDAIADPATGLKQNTISVIAAAAGALRKQADRIAALEAEVANDYREVEYLARLIWEARFKDKCPEWRVAADLRGVVCQLNNMYSDMLRRQGGRAGMKTKIPDCKCGGKVWVTCRADTYQCADCENLLESALYERVGQLEAMLAEREGMVRVPTETLRGWRLQLAFTPDCCTVARQIGDVLAARQQEQEDA